MSEEIDPQKMPSVPRDPKLWEDYFIQVCNERLTLTLDKEKERWDVCSDEYFKPLHSSMTDLLKMPRYIREPWCRIF